MTIISIGIHLLFVKDCLCFSTLPSNIVERGRTCTVSIICVIQSARCLQLDVRRVYYTNQLDCGLCRHDHGGDIENKELEKFPSADDSYGSAAPASYFHKIISEVVPNLELINYHLGVNFVVC